MTNDEPITTPETAMRYATTFMAGVFFGFLITIGAIGYAVSESKATVTVRAAK